MLTSSETLLRAAREGGYAIGAFDVWNLESVLATVEAAEAKHSPVILRIHPEMLRFAGAPFLALCMEAAHSAAVPVALHLDSGASPDDIRYALNRGIRSITVYGWNLPYDRQLQYTRNLTALAHEHGATVEAMFRPVDTTTSMAGRETALLDPAEAATFVERTRVDALAVYYADIGHFQNAMVDDPLGRFQDGDWHLDLVRLAQLEAAVGVPLVVHGASPLPDRIIRIAIELGVAKFDSDAELGVVYLDEVDDHLHGTPEPIPLMVAASSALYNVIAPKLHLYGSSGRAALIPR